MLKNDVRIRLILIDKINCFWLRKDEPNKQQLSGCLRIDKRFVTEGVSDVTRDKLALTPKNPIKQESPPAWTQE